MTTAKSSFYETRPPATTSPQTTKLAETSFYKTTGGDYSSTDDTVTFELLGF